MSLTKKEKDFILNNVEQINNLFNIIDERDLLEKYFPSNEINKWVQSSSSRYDQTETFCLSWILKGNKDFYNVLANYFLKRSEEYKIMSLTMVSGCVETSVDNSQSLIGSGDFELKMTTELLSIKNQVDELQKVDLLSIKNQMDELQKVDLLAIKNEINELRKVKYFMRSSELFKMI